MSCGHTNKNPTSPTCKDSPLLARFDIIIKNSLITLIPTKGGLPMIIGTIDYSSCWLSHNNCSYYGRLLEMTQWSEETGLADYQWHVAHYDFSVKIMCFKVPTLTIFCTFSKLLAFHYPCCEVWLWWLQICNTRIYL